MKNEKGTISNILDSSLITATFFDENLDFSMKNPKQKMSDFFNINSDKVHYDIKIVICGDYVQVYRYDKFQNKKDSDLELKKKKQENEKDVISYLLDKISDNNKQKIDNNSLKEIEERNIIRSKLECQRLAKCNSTEWKTFITLTFKDNIDDVNYCYEQLRKFFLKIQRVFKDFKYLCIPEFQKRGAIHYHLLSNIPINSKIIPKREKLNLWNKEIKKYKELEYYNIKYWNNGFSSAEPLENDIKKIVGYISKYMTKDIDSRLFSHRRYYSSYNLVKPIESYIDLSNKKNLDFLDKVLKNKTLIYENRYENTYDKSNVLFEEFIS